MVIAGGYYNGRATMTLPLTPFLMSTGQELQWSYLGYLPEERQWGPAMGLVANQPTLATSMNYGDVSIDTLNNDYYWERDPQRTLRYKREFAASVTIPHSWLPFYCQF
jgi:hypothetical protein